MTTKAGPALLPVELYDIPQYAARRALDMGIALDEIVGALRNPDKRLPGNAPGTECWTRGRVTAAVTLLPDARVRVRTFLWATDEDWRKDYELPEMDGRKPRTRPTPRHCK